MTQDQTLAIVPVEQATIMFYDHPVIAVRLPDGRIGAVLRNMCDALQLERYSQVRRIRDDDTIADCLVLVLVETPGGAQASDVLTAWAIPYWLQGIQLTRLAPEKREGILAFKREAADVLYRHFSQRSALLAPRETRPAQTMVQPMQPAATAPASEWASYHEEMALFYRWQGAVDSRLDRFENWQGVVESRLESVEEAARLVPELIERLGPEKLTSQHQNAVKHYIQQLSKETSKHPGTIYSELYTAFAVPRYQEIPEAEWNAVENWFRVQLDRARKK